MKVTGVGPFVQSQHRWCPQVYTAGPTPGSQAKDVEAPKYRNSGLRWGNSAQSRICPTRTLSRCSGCEPQALASSSAGLRLASGSTTSVALAPAAASVSSRYYPAPNRAPPSILCPRPFMHVGYRRIKFLAYGLHGGAPDARPIHPSCLTSIVPLNARTPSLPAKMLLNGAQHALHRKWTETNNTCI